MVEKWPPPRYVVKARFRAPLEFVYRWCTDYTPEDARHEAEAYERRILRRTSREVVYEDLADTPNGWAWSRHVVELDPPDHWHSRSVGSHRAIDLDYRLAPRADGGTELTLIARRRPTPVGGRNASKAAWERSVAASWRLFARSLERDYRAAQASRRPRA